MTATQLELLPIEGVEAQDTVEETFELFHERNPHVYEMLREYALMVKRAGGRIGMRALFERLRWDYLIYTTSTTYKLNNNYTPLYARMLMEQEPELAGFFEIRGNR